MVQEKKPYLDKAVELKAEYEKAMASYNAADAEDEVWLCFLTFKFVLYYVCLVFSLLNLLLLFRIERGLTSLIRKRKPLKQKWKS